MNTVLVYFLRMSHIETVWIVHTSTVVVREHRLIELQ